MSRTFNFIYKELTRDDPYEAIFLDDKHPDFNFMVKEIESGYSVTCYFNEFTINTETLELSSSKRVLTEKERDLARIFICDKDEYMNSDAFKIAMRMYRVDLEKEYAEKREAQVLGEASPRLFVSAPGNAIQGQEAESHLKKTPREDASFKAQ